MAIRSGMSNLIKRVRALANAQEDEYAINDDSYWTDEHIQSILDTNAMLVIDTPLAWQPQSIGGGTVTYLIAQASYRDLEEVGSGTARWVVRDGPGAVIGTATYSADYRSGRLSFTSDQGGTAYYLTGYTYDLHAAAADVWAERLAHFSDWYNFSADGQSLNRSEAFDHAVKMERLMRARAGANVISSVSGDLRMAQFVRTDLV